MTELPSEGKSELSGWRRQSAAQYDLRSFFPVSGTTLASGGTGDECFVAGSEAGQSEPVHDDALNVIRHLVEECDSLEKVVVDAEGFGFWGGFSHSILVAVQDEICPSSLDYFGIFNKCRPTDAAVTLALHGDISTRLYPLLFDAELDASMSCRLAAMMETYCTPTLFPAFGVGNMPKGVSSLSLGVSDAGIVPLDALHSLALVNDRSPPAIDVCIGRADGIDRSVYPEYHNLSIYMSDPQASTLCSLSSFLAIDNVQQRPLRRHVRDNIIRPIEGTYHLRKSIRAIEWSDLRECLESLAFEE